MHKSAKQNKQKSHFSRSVQGFHVVKTGQWCTGEMTSAGLTSSPQHSKTMLFPTLQTPSQLSKHRSLQELARIPDFHSLETIVLQHFCIPSKHKDKAYYRTDFMRSRKPSCRAPNSLPLWHTNDLLWGSRVSSDEHPAPHPGLTKLTKTRQQLVSVLAI